MLNKLFLLISFVDTTLVSLYIINDTSLIWLAPVTFVASYLVCMLVIIVFILIVTMPINKKKLYDKFSPFYHRLFTLALEYICNLARVKGDVSGMENIPQDARFLLVGNHRSKFDPMITCYILSKYRLSCISKPSNLKIPLGGGRLMAKDGYMAIDRKNNREGAKTIMRAVEQIKDGNHSVLVYPEGMRNIVNNNLLDFRAGSFKIAVRAECPIVVMTTDGTERIRKNFPFHSSRVKINFMPSINPKNYANTEEISEHVRELMEASLNGKN